VHEEKLNLYLGWSTIKATKLRKMRGERHVACIGRLTHWEYLVGKYE
jgi:hypothetical protein